MKLHGQTILITGGSSGIGLELARQLTPNNTVVICGRSQAKLEEAKKLVPQAYTFCCDISKSGDRTELFHFLKASHLNLTILVNNAAIVHNTEFIKDHDMITKAEAEIATNLIAPIALSKMFLSFIPQPTAIINITTGLVYAPRAVYPIYNATKSALHTFTRVLRYQLKDTNVKIMEVLMPVVDTPWHQGNAPKIAVTPEKAVGEMLSKLQTGKHEIRVGAVKMLYFIYRLSPALAFRLINRIS